MARLFIEGLRTVCGGPFSFSVEAGECVALSGPSGCGKTLLLRALADLDPAEGTVQLDGIERNEMSAPDWRRQVAWLPAESSWWADVVGDHFRGPAVAKAMAGRQRSEVRDQKLPMLGKKQQAPTQLVPSIGKNGELAPRSAVPQRSCLEKLGFEEDVLSWRIERLSTGEKQRLALFRLLLNEPKVLLLDEPTAALDISNVWKAEEVIAQYRAATEAAIVWITHSPEQIERVANRHLELWRSA